jgi:tetratricopeptide (TPR) repeat protein
MLNLLGDDRLQAGAAHEAVELLELNIQAYPTSSNAYDSLADAYIAGGRNDLALAAQEKCLEILPADTIPISSRPTFTGTPRRRSRS